MPEGLSDDAMRPEEVRALRQQALRDGLIDSIPETPTTWTPSRPVQKQDHGLIQMPHFEDEMSRTMHPDEVEKARREYREAQERGEFQDQTGA